MNSFFYLQTNVLAKLCKGHAIPSNAKLIWLPSHLEVENTDQVESIRCTKMVLTRFPTGGFTVAGVVNPPDEKVVNPTLCIGLIARGVAKGGRAAGGQSQFR